MDLRNFISGRLKSHESIPSVSHEAIYQFVYRERQGLIAYPPRKHKKRRKKYPPRTRPLKTHEKTMICGRPSDIDQRKAVGHWESDSMESVNHQPGLNTTIERRTRLVHISRLKGKTAKDTEKVVISRLINHSPFFRSSITFDNGVENWNFKKTENKLNIKSYFCDPYSSWQKGSVEQVIGLIRRYLPKKTDIAKVTDKELIRIESFSITDQESAWGLKLPMR